MCYVLLRTVRFVGIGVGEECLWGCVLCSTVGGRLLFVLVSMGGSFNVDVGFYVL